MTTRDITVTFSDGESHQYLGVPDNVTPEQVEQRASQEFKKTVTNIDGGSGTDSTKKPESPAMQEGRKVGGITGGVLSALQGPSFELLDEAAGAGSAALSSLTGKGPDYQSGRDFVRGAAKQHEEDNPIGSQVGKLVASLPLVLAPGGVARTAALGAKAIQAAKIGLGYGAVEGFGESTAEDAPGLVRDTAIGGASGFGGGGILSGIGTGIGKIASNVAERFSPSGAVQVAREKLAEALKRSSRGELVQTPNALTNASDMAARRMEKLGSESTIADAGGTSTRRLLDTLTTLPGRADQLVEALTRKRNATRGDRLIEAADKSLGTKNAEYKNTMNNFIRQKEDEAGPLYKELNKLNVRVDGELMDLLRASDSAHKGAELSSKLRREIPIDLSKLESGDVISFKSLDAIKRSLYDLGKTSQRSGSQGISNDYNSLRISLINKMDDILPKNEKGSVYKQARDAFSGPSQLQDAVESGRKVMGQDSINVSNIMEGMSKSELEAFRIGALQSIRDQVGTPGGQTKILNMYRASATSGKLKEIFGNDYRKFAADVAREVRLKELEPVGKGSQTASRLMNIEDLDVEPLSNAAQVATSIGSGNPISAAAGSARGAAGLWNKVKTPETTRNELARLLLLRGEAGQKELKNLDPMIKKLNAERMRRATGTGIGAAQVDKQQQE